MSRGLTAMNVPVPGSTAVERVEGLDPEGLVAREVGLRDELVRRRDTMLLIARRALGGGPGALDRDLVVQLIDDTLRFDLNAAREAANSLAAHLSTREVEDAAGAQE